MSDSLRLLLASCALLSAITVGVYGFDKRAARLGRRRVPEIHLHLLALLGGWPGALLAMRVFRHKRRKLGFVALTLAIALAHGALLAWLLLRP